ncbi:DUF4340 domain-containing protein [Maricaulis parjimensis]|uniref:DUF4340 domain-containing protein n=1 Tax=Maricaulis parjimensis TaxID=144023 RepID=UPI00193A32C4|nr:DUF4340 domain-containing protein [Maricaulis parjimensis]
MSQNMDRQRLKRLSVTGGLAVVLFVLALGTVWMQASQGWKPEVSGPVLPDWPQAVDAAQSIAIRSASDDFTLERTEAGWVMPSRDNYPVRPDQLAELDRLLAGLTYIGARTADPDKHARLGLAAGGENAATRVTVRGADGDVLADILLGEASGERIYVRFPGRDRTFAAGFQMSGSDLPALANAADWLALDFLDLGVNAIASARISPPEGPDYFLERAGLSVRNFALREPGGWRPITAAAGNGPANALARVRFRDVRAADRIGGEVIARHVAETFTGIRVSVDVLQLGETRWARLQAQALSDEAADSVAALNAAADGWAFLLSDLTLERLIRPLDMIADPRPEESPDAP